MHCGITSNCKSHLLTFTSGNISNITFRHNKALNIYANLSFVTEITCVREIGCLKMFEREVKALRQCRDPSVFCKVTSPKTSEIVQHFNIYSRDKKHSGLGSLQKERGR